MSSIKMSSNAHYTVPKPEGPCNISIRVKDFLIYPSMGSTDLRVGVQMIFKEVE
jgi:hypothetical protein